MDSGVRGRALSRGRGSRRNRKTRPYMRSNLSDPPPATVEYRCPRSPKTDPAINDSLLIEGLAGSYAVPKRREFQVDFSQYIQLIRSSYDAECLADKSIRKTISFGMFQYYAVYLLWKRIMHLRAARGSYSVEYTLISQLIPIELAVPKDLAVYLSCIGHFTDPSGSKYEFVLQRDLDPQDVDGAQGSYGTVDAQNSNAYSCLPAPVITLLKMRADLQYVADRRTNIAPVAEWDLPFGLRPAAVGPQLPSANLLGWTPAVPITVDQEDAILTSGITLQHFTVTNVAGIPVNRRLISFVSGLLENSKAKSFFKMPTSVNGSVAQAAYTTPSAHDNAILPLVPISAKAGSTYSYSQGSIYSAGAATIFRFRVQRRQPGNNDSICYRFVGVPPAAWLNHANDTFQFGGGAIWNTDQFGAGTHDGAGLAIQFSTKVRKS